MKKFLSKKPVMITFIVLAVLFLAVYIGLLVRPISVGMSYTHKTDDGKVTLQIKSSKKLIQKDGDNEIGYWYTVIDGKMYPIGLTSIMTEEAYNSAVKTLKENEMLRNSTTKVNTFVIIDGEDSFVCAGAIVFAVIGGLAELGLISFAVLSIANQKKRKKSSKK